jgi:RNA polymerase sigma factor (sigma-70 family)
MAENQPLTGRAGKTKNCNQSRVCWHIVVRHLDSKGAGMARPEWNTVLRQLRCWVGLPATQEQSDRSLLQQFTAQHDQDAFAQLVQRHGPMVLATCRRALHDWTDAEDAFQATFCVLARRAGAISWDESIGAWLHAVAWRVATKARARRALRAQQEKESAAMRATTPATEVDAEQRHLLDQALNCLPKKYRAPLVLCYLEGHTNEEAARQLGWPKGTVQGRLARGREMLRGILTRRGLTVTASAFGPLLAANATQAEMSATLAARTVEIAAVYASGKGAGAAALLADEVLRVMKVARMKWIATVLLVIGMFGTGMVVAAWSLGFSESAPEPEPPGVLEAWPTWKRRNAVELPREGFHWVTFSPDSKTLLSADDTIRFWEVATGKERLTLAELDRSPGQWGGYRFPQLSRDGKKLTALVSDTTALVWDVDTRIDTTFRTPNAWIECVALSPDGKLLATGGKGEVYNRLDKIKLWDVASREELATLRGHEDTVRLLTFSPDGKTLVSACAAEVRLWDVAGRKERATLKVAAGGSDEIPSLLFSPDSRTLAVASGTAVRLWDTATAKELPACRGGGDMHLIGFTRDRQLVTSSQKEVDEQSIGVLQCWDLATGKDRVIYKATYPLGMNLPTLSPDGKVLAGFVWDQSAEYVDVKLWDLPTGKEIATLREHGAAPYAVVFSADGQRLALVCSRRVSLWEQGPR